MSDPGAFRAIARLTYRDRDGLDVSRVITAADAPISVGRGAEVDLMLAHDPRVSRLHAQLDYVAGSWLVLDGGLSTNGTFVASQRVSQRRRLRAGDVIAVGGTELRFEPLSAPEPVETADEERERLLMRLGDADRALLTALGRSVRVDPAGLAATDTQLGEVFDLAPEAIHVRLRQLAAWLRFDVAPWANARSALATFAARRQEDELG